jgi:hypothetical protein
MQWRGEEWYELCVLDGGEVRCTEPHARHVLIAADGSADGNQWER